MRLQFLVDPQELGTLVGPRQTRRRDLEPFSSSSLGPAFEQDPGDHAWYASRSYWVVTVSHGDLRFLGVPVVHTPIPEVSVQLRARPQHVGELQLASGFPYLESAGNDYVQNKMRTPPRFKRIVVLGDPHRIFIHRAGWLRSLGS